MVYACLLILLLSLSSRQPSIPSFRVRALEKARAVHRIGRLKGIVEDLTAETEFVGEGKLLLNTLWKRKFKRFMENYALPWDEHDFCRHLGRAREAQKSESL